MSNSDKKVQNQWIDPGQNPGGSQWTFPEQNPGGPQWTCPVQNQWIDPGQNPEGSQLTYMLYAYMPQQYIQVPIHPQHQQFIYAAPNGVWNPTPMQPSPYGAVLLVGGGGYNTYAPAAGLQTSAAPQPQQNIYSQQPFFAQGGISYARGLGGQYQPMVYQPQQTMPQPQQVVPQQQFVPPQQQQIAVTQPPPSLAKREKKILQFINPNTGRSIFNNGVSQSAATRIPAPPPPPPAHWIPAPPPTPPAPWIPAPPPPPPSPCIPATPPPPPAHWIPAPPPTPPASTPAAPPATRKKHTYRCFPVTPPPPPAHWIPAPPPTPPAPWIPAPPPHPPSAWIPAPPPPPFVGAPKELNAGPGTSAGEDKHSESSAVKQDDSKHSHPPPSTATTIPQHPPPSMANSGPTGHHPPPQTNMPPPQKWYQYDREFLIQLQFDKMSTIKPENLPEPSYIKSSVSQSQQHGGPGGPGGRGMGKHASTSKKPVRRINIPSSSQKVELHKSKNAWKPAVATKKKTEEQEANEIEELKKKVRAILNKLTPQKFEVLVKQFQELPIVTKETMESSMELVFEKAVGEPAFSVAYAQMCHHLSQREIPVEGGEKVKFRTILIRRVQKEFDKDYMKDVDLALKKKSVNMELSKDERDKAKHEFEMQERKARQRSLGNIRFIGELYNLQLLTVNDMHDCVNKLITKTDKESLEGLCQLITTVGSQFEKETNLIMLNQKEGKISKENQRKKYPSVRPITDYFNKMHDIINKKATSSRVRFLMQDVIDLRKASWKKRREEAGPKKIDQIHEDMKKEQLSAELNSMNTRGMPQQRRTGGRKWSQRKY